MKLWLFLPLPEWQVCKIKYTFVALQNTHTFVLSFSAANQCYIILMDNIDRRQNFEFRVANKAGIFILVIVKGINDEVVDYYIVKNVMRS